MEMTKEQLERCSRRTEQLGAKIDVVGSKIDGLHIREASDYSSDLSLCKEVADRIQRLCTIHEDAKAQFEKLLANADKLHNTLIRFGSSQ